MKNKLFLFLFVNVAVFAFAAWTRGEQTVVKVHDADTVTLENGLIIRLSQIDAPELKQPYGDSARAFVALMLLNKQVRIVKHKKDFYGRTLADIYLMDGTYFNGLEVKKGYAWTSKYTTRKKLFAYTIKAQKDSVGLWKYPPYISPTVWRKTH